MAGAADRLRVVKGARARRGAVAPALLMALLAALGPGAVHAALPPPSAPEAAPPKAGAAGAPALAGAAEPVESGWFMPPVRFGGVLSYNLRRDMSDENTRTQQGVNATVQASTGTYIWQPWFARLDGTLGVTMSRDSSSGDNTDSGASKSIFVTGSGQLTVLALSPYPFEAHFERNDSRVSNDLSIANGYASQRYGFTQHYFRPAGGNAMLGWDRSTQTSDLTGRDKQDTLSLDLAHSLGDHRLHLTGNGTWNTHELSGEEAVQKNLNLQYNYAPSPSFSVDTTANASRSGYHLQQGDNDSRVMQLSSLAFWRPADQKMTVTGGARLFALQNDSSFNDTFGGGSTNGARIRNANANLGVNYDLSQFTRLNASANVNQVDNNGVKTSSTDQTVGASYQPASIELGKYRYNWSTSGSATNRTGELDAGRQFSAQLTHNIGRTFRLDGGSAIGVDASQALSATAGTGINNGGINNDGLNNDGGTSTKRLTHSASVSWDLARETGSAQVRLSASDSRELGGRREFFQLINLQASSDLPTGQFSSWSGNLTVQAVRQSSNTFVDLGAPVPTTTLANQEPKRGYELSSGASLTYQNQRMFGVRRLRFVSDLRLNSQALLPLLGSVRDQETAAWDNRFDYAIGRTQLRLSAIIARNGTPNATIDSFGNATNVVKVNRTNKSIAFSASRSF
jgi:hypothetical protein